MKLTNIMGARLTLDSGEEVTLERLGKGQFHVCYVDRSVAEVYSITIDRGSVEMEDYSKEILSKCHANPHIPPVTYVGTLGDRRVYKMPLYQPLRSREHRAAWGHLQRLQQARKDAWDAIVKEQGVGHWNPTERKMRLTDIGYLVNVRTQKLVDVPETPQSLKDALEELTDTASQYGSNYVFEFSRRNCLVNAAGTLVLLDVQLNLEAIEHIQTARQKQMGRKF